MRKISFFFAILSFFAVSTCYGQGDSCLRLYCDPAICYNPDSVMVDTCSSSLTYEKRFCKTGFSVEFLDNVMNVGYGAPDSILEVTWESIDTSYASIRSAFQDIYNTRGAYVFRKVYPTDTASSSTSSRLYKIRFLEYTLVDSVLLEIDAIDRIYFTFNKPEIPKSIFSEKQKVGYEVEFSNGQIRIQNTESKYSQPLEISIYSILGDKHYHAYMSYPVYTISTISLPTGVYILSVGGYSYKFTIQK